jgi:hypothetical protein
MFDEALLQFIWQSRLIEPKQLQTKGGHDIEILSPGTLNLDAGPDFFNGQIRIKGITLAGNIELHLKTSDWLKHGHTQNKNYDNIILHVVYEHDLDLVQNKKHAVEVLELKHYIAPETIQVYNDLFSSKQTLACARQLKQTNDFKFIAWIERMAIERLELKIKQIDLLFVSFSGDYTQTFYTLLLKNFGFKVNALPFELLAKHLPVHLVLKHADNLFQLEALFLGMAGFLEEPFQDKYLKDLQNEFEHLKNKYGLKILQKEIFKFSKLRPANFPTIRLAQIAALVFAQTALVNRPQSFTDYNAIKKSLMFVLKGYWENHYRPGGAAVAKQISIGEDSAENVIINTLAPFFFFYGKKLSKNNYSDLAIELLVRCKFENNNKTRLFSEKKNILANAANSQGIINLFDRYCVTKQCLKCGIASDLMRGGL